MIHLFKKTFFSLLIILLSISVQAQNFDMNNKALSIYLDAENAFMSEDYTKAFTLYNQVLENDKDFDPAMFQLARINLLRNQVNDALNWAY